MSTGIGRRRFSLATNAQMEFSFVYSWLPTFHSCIRVCLLFIRVFVSAYFSFVHSCLPTFHSCIRVCLLFIRVFVSAYFSFVYSCLPTFHSCIRVCLLFIRVFVSAYFSFVHSCLLIFHSCIRGLSINYPLSPWPLCLRLFLRGIIGHKQCPHFW